MESNNYANKNREEAVAMASELTGISKEDITGNGQFIYFPTELPIDDLERTSQKLADLGLVNELVDIPDRVLTE